MSTGPQPGRPPARKSVARAELRLALPNHLPLREVPLKPDPLAAFAAAVADVRPELGEDAQIAIDLLPLTPARSRHHRKRAARAAQQPAAGPRSLGAAIGAQLQMGLQATKGVHAVSPPRAPRPERPARAAAAAAMGKYTADDPLFSIQILIRITSDIPDRAQAHLKKVLSAFNVWDGENYLRVVGRNLGPWHLGSDARTRRRRFDRRFETGLFDPSAESVVTGREIAGLLKPPTKHCAPMNVERSGGLVPPAPAELPTYTVGAAGILPLGYVTNADGTERFAGAPLDETLFSLILGKAGFGKTELMLTQMIALARAGYGTWFLDPHRDAARRAMPYLAAPGVAERVLDIDLTVRRSNELICNWNPLCMIGRDADDIPDVVGSITSAFASALGWDSTSNRALTILSKACEALADLSLKMVQRGTPELAPTIFQIPTLLTDKDWREAVVARLDEQYRRFWIHTFPNYPTDAIPVVTNAIERLSTSNTARAFLGGPISTYDVREAMDTGKVVFVCPAGASPTDRLVSCLLIFDLFRAGLSRRDQRPQDRREFYAFIDELTAVDGASKGTLAAIVEQLRKFMVRLYAATQMAGRLTPATRDALMQNKSVLSTTASEAEAARLVARQWSGDVEPETVMMLPRYHHILSVTLGGAATTPFKIRGAEVTEVFAPWFEPEGEAVIAQHVNATLRRRPIGQVLVQLAKLDERIHDAVGRRAKETEREDGGGGRKRRGGGSAATAAGQADAPLRGTGAPGSEIGGSVPAGDPAAGTGTPGGPIRPPAPQDDPGDESGSVAE